MVLQAHGEFDDDDDPDGLDIIPACLTTTPRSVSSSREVIKSIILCTFAVFFVKLCLLVFFHHLSDDLLFLIVVFVLLLLMDSSFALSLYFGGTLLFSSSFWTADSFRMNSRNLHHHQDHGAPPILTLCSVCPEIESHSSPSDDPLFPPLDSFHLLLFDALHLTHSSLCTILIFIIQRDHS